MIIANIITLKQIITSAQHIILIMIIILLANIWLVQILFHQNNGCMMLICQIDMANQLDQYYNTKVTYIKMKNLYKATKHKYLMINAKYALLKENKNSF